MYHEKQHDTRDVGNNLAFLSACGSANSNYKEKY